MPVQGYVAATSNGWLRARSADTGAEIALPEYLNIEIGDIANGREHFRVLEGVHAGKRCHVVHGGHVKPGNPGYAGPAQLRFALRREALHYRGGLVHAFTDTVNPIQPGTYPIQIPDFPHKKGQPYLGRSAHALCWMYLGRGAATAGRDDRYLHCGGASLGCITVKPEGWSAVYASLILCRSGDGKTLGTATVTEI